MRATLRVSFLILVSILMLGIVGPAHAQTDALLVDGHWIRGEFLKFYQSVPDELLMFGYPITEEFTDSKTGRLTQYFNRARFELVNTDQGEVVVLSPLGQMLYEPGTGQLAEMETNSMVCRTFTATSYDVCYAFLRFYDANDGETFLGNPISAMEIHNGRLVQYFERARLEWRPEMPAGSRVVITELGNVYHDLHLDEIPTSPIEEKGINAPVTVTPRQLQAHAFVTNALIQSNSWQTLFVVVQDENFAPVQGAQVSISVLFPDGTRYDVRANPTNADGISEHSFVVKDLPVREVVQVDITVDYLDKQVETASWFRIWW